MSDDRQYTQKGAGGGHAWSESAEAASSYLRARTPYPPYLINTIVAFHELSSKEPARWDAVLDLGCGPGQLAIHMSKYFKTIYGRDISEQMLAIARTLPTMDDDELESVGLFKPEADRQFDFRLGKEYELNLPDNSVDMITIGAAAHWFDWSSTEACRRIWTEWTRVLRKNGSIIITGSVPVAGSWTGPESDRTRPLRRMLRNLTHSGELAKYYSQTQKTVGAGSLYADLVMPWQLGAAEEAPHKQWDDSSRIFLLYDYPTDVSIEGQKEAVSDPSPSWMPKQLSQYVDEPSKAYEDVIEQWKTTTPRRMAVFLRSASAYVHHLRDNPDDKPRIGRDDDLAARMIKEACREGGLDYDEQIEMHQSSSLLALRRNQL